MTKLRSVVKKVCLDKARPANLKDLGPAARIRYDMTGQDRAQQDKSRPGTESSGRSEDHRYSKPHPCHSDKSSSQRNSGQSTNQKSAQPKEESLASKLIADKEHDKRYKKVVENPMLYLEEHYHQIDPVEHQLEVHSMRFFGGWGREHPD